MTRAEARMLQDWLIGEQWDEGEYDADILYDIDPEGFWAILDDDGEMVGGLSIIASTDSIGSVSHFYVRPEARGSGWARRAIPTLLEIHGHRIHDYVTLTNFCWPAAVDTSARIGFTALHEELRMVRPPSTAPEAMESAVVIDGRAMDVQDLIAFDAARSGRERATLWRRWLDLPGATTLASLAADGSIHALGTIRPTALGHRVGPLDSVNADAARQVLLGLIPLARGTRIAMDVPAVNDDAVDLARSFGFVEEFRTVRTVWGVVPDLPWHERYATVMLHLD
jgi:GNAT superfamily N-acetyltransferase